MKQLIVLIATIILGLAIGGMITGFSDDAENLTGQASDAMDAITVTSSAWEL